MSEGFGPWNGPKGNLSAILEALTRPSAEAISGGFDFGFLPGSVFHSRRRSYYLFLLLFLLFVMVRGYRRNIAVMVRGYRRNIAVMVRVYRRKTVDMGEGL